MYWQPMRLRNSGCDVIGVSINTGPHCEWNECPKNPFCSESVRAPEGEGGGGGGQTRMKQRKTLQCSKRKYVEIKIQLLKTSLVTLSK